MDNLIKIKKIKHKQNPTAIEIEYTQKNRMGRWDEKRLKSSDEPLPEFDEAIKGMVQHLIEEAELPHELEIGAKVTGISISWHNNIKIEDHQTLEDAKYDIGCVITGQRKLKQANSPLNINTPHKNAINENNEDMQLSEGCIASLHECIRVAERYISGERAQLDMFADEPKKAA